MNCIKYIRVSSEDQVKNFSLDTQDEICSKHAERLGYKVIKTFREEGESAKTTNRPELIKMLEYCRKNQKKINAVLVYRFDRIARSTLDHLAIKSKLSEIGIKLESASEPTDDSPSGRFLETILASVAQLDNEVRAEKSKAGLYKRFKAGLTTRPPLGYTVKEVNGRKIAVKDPKYFDLIKRAWDLMETGTKSLTEMAEEMNKMGIAIYWGKKRKPVTKQYASKLFNNKFYAGYLVSKTYQEEVKGIHKPMITLDTFYKVQAFLSKNNRVPIYVKYNVKNPLFPLKGLLKCSECGRRLVAGNTKGRNKKYPKYWCPNNCIHTIDSSKVENELKNNLSQIQPNKDLVNAFTLMLKKKYESRKELFSKKKTDASKKVKEQKEQLRLLVRGNMEGKYPDDVFEDEKKRIEEKILTYQIIANDSLCDKYDIENIVNFIKALFKDLAKAYEVSEYGQKRVLLGSIYPSGMMHDGSKLLNPEISPGFRAIKEFSGDDVALSVGERT
jgi:site-specific DNA recombinase